MNLLKCKCRWLTREIIQLSEMGVETNKDDYVLREVYINVNNIVYIAEFDGMICLTMCDGSQLITNIPYSNINLFMNTN